MNSLRIAFTELRRLTAGRMPRIAIIAMVLIPTLYGGLYLYANYDPYGRLDQIPAALVVDDEPADINGTSRSIGRDVADELLASGDFDWQEVSADEAAEGVENGDYDFALTIPSDFSASLASTADFDPQQAQLKMTTNDANSYLSTTIADEVTDSVRDSIASEVSEEAANQFLLGISDVRSNLVDAASGAGDLADGLDDASAGAAELADGASELDDGLATLETSTTSLPDQTSALAAGAQEVADGNDQIAEIGDQAEEVVTAVGDSYDTGRSDLVDLMDQQGLSADQKNAILDAYDQLGTPIDQAEKQVGQASKDLDRLAQGADAVATGAAELSTATPGLVQGIRDAHTGAGQVSQGAQDLEEGVVQLSTGAHQLKKGLRQGVKQLPDVDDSTRTAVAATIGDPVTVENTAQTSAGTYGAGLAPFFLSLAAWIGGYVLFLLFRPLSRRAMAANQTPLRVALGGWFAPVSVGIAQMAVMLTVVAVAVKIQPADFPATLAFLILVSAVFIAIVHMLNAWLGAAGQFLGLVLMVVQLVSAGGTFPWQTIPAPLYPVHHVLPMSYAVDGLRQLMYGGQLDRVTTDVLVLLAWGVGALTLTAVAARRQRRWTVSRIQPELTL